MKVTNLNQAVKESFANPIFTGDDVTIQYLAPDSEDFSVNVVNFGRGVRNKWHAHDCDQILIVTAGKGIVALEGEERTVTVGDVILIPAGQKHWHGASGDSDFSHIYVIKKGGELTRFEE